MERILKAFRYPKENNTMHKTDVHLFKIAFYMFGNNPLWHTAIQLIKKVVIKAI